ncbi:MAG: family 16 glycosylhydrolase [Bacteroidota bacterium]
MRYLVLFAFSFLLFTCSEKEPAAVNPALEEGGPPPPPEGYHWEIDPAFSDEFETAKLDAKKWHDRSPYWVNGRPPATFRASAVSVKDGQLQIRNQPLGEEDTTYHIAGGAVASVARDAHFGYFSTRMKASSISMSSTFWMKNKPTPGDCRQLVQELDIIEVVGKRDRGPDFRNVMHCNTHIFHKDCATGEKLKTKSKGAQAPIVPAADEAYHIYACWWENATTLHFYLDGEEVATVTPLEPFDRDMYMHLVTETYYWENPPPEEDLLNDAINTTYYDWVRSYKLVANGK